MAKKLTQLDPSTCPLAIAEIKLRCEKQESDVVVFKGLGYQLDGNSVWHVGASWSTNEPFSNDWNDSSFGL